MNKTYFDTAEVKNVLKCKACNKEFQNVVKRIPDCGSAICGVCYEGFKANVDSSGEYQCSTCQKWHKLPDQMPDDKMLMELVNLIPKEMKISLAAQNLKDGICQLEKKIVELDSSFILEELYNQFDQLKEKVSVAIDSAIRHLTTIEEKMFARIQEAQDEIRTKVDDNAINNLITGKKDKMDKFMNRWKAYFTNLDVIVADSDLKKAQIEAQTFTSQIEDLKNAIKADLRSSASLEFKLNDEFFKNENLLGRLIGASDIKEGETFNANQTNNTTGCLNSLTKSYRDKYSEVIKLQTRLSDLYEDIYQQYHIETARCLSSLGEAYSKVNMHKEAERHLNDALDMYKHIYPTGHEDTTRCLNKLAKAYSRSGKQSEAMRFDVEYFSIYRQIYKDFQSSDLEIVSRQSDYHPALTYNKTVISKQLTSKVRFHAPTTIFNQPLNLRFPWLRFSRQFRPVLGRGAAAKTIACFVSSTYLARSYIFSAYPFQPKLHLV